MCLCNLFWHICPPVPPIPVFHPISRATLWPLHIIVINNPWIQLKCCQYMWWVRMRAPTGAWAIPKGKWHSLQLPTDKSSSSKGRRRWGPGVYSFDSSALCQRYAGHRSCWELTSTTRMLFLEVGVSQPSSSSTSSCDIISSAPSMMFPKLWMGGGLHRWFIPQLSTHSYLYSIWYSLIIFIHQYILPLLCMVPDSTSLPTLCPLLLYCY